MIGRERQRRGTFGRARGQCSWGSAALPLLRLGVDRAYGMAADKPIHFAEHVQLTSLGIAPESISFANVTLESEKYVCVREATGAGNSVAIVDLNNIGQVYVETVCAEN